MKVLLINPPLFKSDTNVWKHIDSCTPPFGLAILGAVLRTNNIEVEIFDCNALVIPVSLLPEKLPRRPYDYIGVTATTALIDNGLAIADICRKAFPEARIVMGGVHPTILPQECLSRNSVDYVIRGEGERTFLNLLQGVALPSIPGLSFRSDGEIIHNPPSKDPIDLDAIPMPAYDLLPMERYHTALGSSLRTPNIGMIASRGCPGKCTFCYGSVLGKVLRFRSPQKIFREIQHLQDNYGIKEIAFYDDTFTTFKHKVAELCQLIIRNKMDLTWSCFSRVDTVDYPTLKIMRQAGCHQVSIGVESGNEQILKNIKKNIDLDRAISMVRDCKNLGITVRACFMLGNPGETGETIRSTLAFSRKLDPDIVLYNITTPYPGTEMFAWAKEHGYLTTEDWRDYDLSKAVMELPTIPSLELEEIYRKAYRSFYLRPAYLVKRLLKIRSAHDIRTNWNAFRAMLKFGA